MSLALEVKNLTKVYGDFKAVDDITFSVKSGEIVGLLGPNGAGKTTTINMILGVLEPTQGDISVLRANARTDRSVREKMNFAAVYAQLPGNITVWQNLYIFGLLYNVPQLKKRIASLLKEFDLEKFKNVKTGLLSSGEMTRVSLAKAMLNEPRLFLLDEPTASLDPNTSHLLRDKIKEYVRQTDTGILWTSHDMYEIEAICDRVLFLSHGKILLEGNPQELPAQYGKKNLEELFITVAREPLLLHELS